MKLSHGAFELTLKEINQETEEVKKIIGDLYDQCLNREDLDNKNLIIVQGVVYKIVGKKRTFFG